MYIKKIVFWLVFTLSWFKCDFAEPEQSQDDSKYRETVTVTVEGKYALS